MTTKIHVNVEMPSCETQVMSARTCQNYYYTMIGLESPDLPHAN